MSKERTVARKTINDLGLHTRGSSAARALKRPRTILLTRCPAVEKSLLPAIQRLIAKQERSTRDSKQPAKDAGEGRWPLDLVREASGSGLLALRVWKDAGLEGYGLVGGDIIMIGLEDPSDGEPAFAAINDQIAIGWFRSRPGGRVRIVPFVDGTPPVTAGPDDAQVLFKLEAIVSQRRLINHRRARRGAGGADKKSIV